MILSCCFRNPNNRQKKKDVGKTSLQEYDSEPLRHSTSASTRRNSNDQNLRTKYQQEKYPASKKEKRVLKQRSQDSLGRQISSSSLTRSNASPVAQPVDLLPLRCQSELLPSPPETPRLYKAPNRHSTIETANVGSLETSTVETSRSRDSPATEIEVKECKLESKHSEKTDVQPSPGAPPENQEHQVEQVRLKEIEIELLKVNHDLMIQKLKEEHKCSLDQVKEFYVGKLEQDVSAARSETEEALLRITNEANESMTRLNAQLEAEKKNIQQEHERVLEGVRSELREREEKLSEAFREISEREQGWQEEKADVLREVQRLKAEASKMVSILALEYEEENLTEEKKRSLSAEVYSLQLVVEMRTGEVRNLRDQLASLTHQMEAMEGVQSRLDKANARIEDLQEQLKLKVESEQLLSSEKYQLENSVLHSSRAVERMSQNVEELQWRIRNNYELPVEICSPSATRPTHLVFERLTSSELDGMNTESRHSVDDQARKLENITESGTEEKKNRLFPVSQGMPEATANEVLDTAAVESTISPTPLTASSDLSPNSDLNLEEDISLKEKEQGEQNDGNNNIANPDGNLDGDSLDEGLGDISSEGENAESPVPPVPHTVPNFNKNDCIGEISNTNESQATAKESSSKLYQDSERERRPSRISFETPL